MEASPQLRFSLPRCDKVTTDNSHDRRLYFLIHDCLGRDQPIVSCTSHGQVVLGGISSSPCCPGNYAHGPDQGYNCSYVGVCVHAFTISPALMDVGGCCCFCCCFVLLYFIWFWFCSDINDCRIIAENERY